MKRKTGRVALKAAYRRYEQSGSPGRNYFTAGAEIEF